MAWSDDSCSENALKAAWVDLAKAFRERSCDCTTKSCTVCPFTSRGRFSRQGKTDWIGQKQITTPRYQVLEHLINLVVVHMLGLEPSLQHERYATPVEGFSTLHDRAQIWIKHPEYMREAPRWSSYNGLLQSCKDYQHQKMIGTLENQSHLGALNDSAEYDGV